MDPASEELERRSRYLSSLIRRTKLSAAPASLLPPVPEPEDAPELAPAGAGFEKPREEEGVAAVGEKEKREVKPAVEREERVEMGAEKEKREVKGAADGKGKQIKGKDEEPKKVAVRVRAADMPLPLTCPCRCSAGRSGSPTRPSPPCRGWTASASPSRSRRTLIRHMVLLGIALLGRALVPMSLTLLEVSCTSLSTKSIFFSLELLLSRWAIHNETPKWRAS